MAKRLDRLLDLLMRPRVRRVRRWSFVITLPVAGLVFWLVGVQTGAAVIVGRGALTLVVLVTAWRVRGERGDALRELLMHPRAQRVMRAEADVLMTIPRLVLARGRGLSYHRGDDGLTLVFALIPPTIAEAAIVHLLLPSGWIQVAAAVLHAYALVWLVGWLLGPRAYRHRVGRGVLLVRNGPLYRARIPLEAIATITPCRASVRGEASLVVGDGEARLPARRRIDAWIELHEPIAVQRPLGEPVRVRRLAIAVDDPTALIAAVSAGHDHVGAPRGHHAFDVVVGADLARDALATS